MAITLTQKYLDNLRKRVNAPNVIIEVALDSGIVKWGYATGGFTDVLPIVKSVSSFQNRLDTKSGFSTRGQISIVIAGRDNFKGLVSGNYLKNRRVVRKDGFIAPGFAYTDYATTYSGIVTDWSRKEDELTITVSDDLVDASVKIPVENSTKTQYLDYRNLNPVDIMKDILSAQLGINEDYIDAAKFDSERDLWLNGWIYSRVITDPKEADGYLNELQIESNSFVIHDGEKISFKVFAPPIPGAAVEEWTDGANILEGSFSQKSGYKDGFYNRVIVYYDYDESGSDSESNYDSAVIAIDGASQDSTEWDEASTKTVYSKWIRSATFSQTTNIGGVKAYHVSNANGAGAGTLAFTYDATNGSVLQWTPPGGTIGEAVNVTDDGKFDIYGSDTTKFIRVIVTTASLPASNATDTVTIRRIDGNKYAISLATKILNRYRDPVSTVSFDIDINNVAYNSAFIKPTDIKDITTDEACGMGSSTWNKERVMLTSVRPDFEANRISIEAIETRMYRQYGFITPSGYPDYPRATAAQRLYAYIGDGGNKLNHGNIDGDYIW